MDAHFQADSADGLDWRRSRRCGTKQCIEVAAGTKGIHVRDSERPHGPRLKYGRKNWRAFVKSVGQGHFEPRS